MFEEDMLETVDKLEDCIKMAQKICIACLKMDFPAIRYLSGEISNRLPYIPQEEKIAGVSRENGPFVFDQEAAQYFLKHANQAYWNLIKAYKAAFKKDMITCAEMVQTVNQLYGQGLEIAATKYEDEFPSGLRFNDTINPA